MDKFCRVCSRSDVFQKFDLSTISQISNVQIDDMLVYCTQQQISTGDSLPQHICADCFAALNSAFVFRKLTYHSENGFRQMINSNWAASEPSPNVAVSLMPVPVEVVDPNLVEVTFKEESIEVEEPPLVADYIPENCPEILPIEVDLICASDPIDEGTQSRKKRRSMKIFGAPTTYLCRDCGYATQNCFNFKRHQQNQKHTSHSKMFTKRPLHMIKDLIKPFVKPKTPKIPKNPKIKPLVIKQKPKKSDTKPTTTKRTRRAPNSTVRTVYRCDDCGHQNHIKYNFTRHQRIWNHAGVTTLQVSLTENVIKCRDCGEQVSSNARLRAHRRNGCRPLEKNLDSDYVYSDEALAIGRIFSARRTLVKHEMEVAEPTVELKTEPSDDEAPSEQLVLGV